MNLAVIKNVGAVKLAGKSLGRGTLIVQKYSPQILTTVGVVGVVTSAVLASKATLKLEGIVDAAQDAIASAEELNSTLSADEYSSLDHKKAVTRVYMSSTISIVKLYGPSVTLGVASIGCLLGAQGIMHKRNVALIAAYKTVEESFSKYRERVVEELGADKDFDFRNGFRTEKVKDEETGKTKKLTHIDPNGISPYSRFFDELCPAWDKTGEYNLLFVRAQQTMANDILQARGHLFLNEVYDMFDIPHSKEGAIVGWVLNGDGDNFVDFGLYDPNSDRAREFVNGFEKSILLTFNVDGIIYDKI